ncbi:unnamed protein product [Paramecium pentaurelia]|uniref:Orn/DAP/Arg decarboxylase 2 N-terminal domain-containing protein n=1 Tax=Paramecium pentaurelia TaxID=43138 RepID=A0A8S1SD52_9CILI|nr:unnamed protein product [Paramecium pentaurelia]
MNLKIRQINGNYLFLGSHLIKQLRAILLNLYYKISQMDYMELLIVHQKEKSKWQLNMEFLIRSLFIVIQLKRKKTYTLQKIKEFQQQVLIVLRNQSRSKRQHHRQRYYGEYLLLKRTQNKKLLFFLVNLEMTCYIQILLIKDLSKFKKMKIQLHGIHFHCGCAVQGSSSFGKGIDLAQYFMRIGRLYGHKMELLDLGGGFPTGSIHGYAIKALKKHKIILQDMKQLLKQEDIFVLIHVHFCVQNFDQKNQAWQIMLSCQ